VVQRRLPLSQILPHRVARLIDREIHVWTLLRACPIDCCPGLYTPFRASLSKPSQRSVFRFYTHGKPLSDTLQEMDRFYRRLRPGLGLN
jgi:hypothetical protein